MALSAVASLVTYFQNKLSNYDKQSGEASVEQRILQGIESDDVRERRTFLIDVDVVRGSVFAKNKPRHGWSQALLLGVLRSTFAPFYWDYWCGHTSFRLAAYIMFHFALQFIQAVCFLLIDPTSSKSSQDDVIVPFLLAVGLGILHSHITASHGSLASTNPLATETEVKSSLSSWLANRTSVSELVENDPVSEHQTMFCRVRTNTSDTHARHRSRLGIGDMNHIAVSSECFTELEEIEHLLPSGNVSHKVRHPSQSVLSTGLPTCSEVCNDSAGKPVCRWNRNSVSQFTSRHLGGVDGAMSKPAFCDVRHSDAVDTHRPLVQSIPTGRSALSEEEETEGDESSDCVGTHRRHSSSNSRCDIVQSPHGHDADVEESDSDTQPVQSLCSSTRHSEFNVNDPQMIGPFGGTSFLDDECSLPREHVNQSHEFDNSVAHESHAGTIRSNYKFNVVATPNFVIPGMLSSNHSVPSAALQTGHYSECVGSTLSPLIQTLPKVRNITRKRCSSIALPIDSRRSNTPPFGSMLFLSNGVLTSDEQRCRPRPFFSNSNLNRSFLTNMSLRAALMSQYADRAGSDGIYSRPIRLNSSPFRIGGFVVHPFSHMIHSSDSTLSSGASTSSVPSRAEPAQVRACRLLGPESIHEIGAELGFLPNCYARSHLMGPGLLGSMSKVSTDPGAVTDDGFKPTELKPKSVISKSLINLHEDHFDINDPSSCVPLGLMCSAPRSNLGHILPHAIDPMTLDTKECSTKNGYVSPSKQEISTHRRMNGLIDMTATTNDEDTITTHSRQRAKFLHLFMRRACLGGQQQPHSLQSRSMDKVCKSNQFSQYANLSTTMSYLSNGLVAEISTDKHDAEVSKRDPRTLVNRKYVSRDASHSNLTFRERRTCKGPNATSMEHYLLKNHKNDCNTTRNIAFPSRALTTSETECDRINSDVGSDVDSSSDPNEVDPLPIPAGQSKTTTFNAWKSELLDQPIHSLQNAKDTKRVNLTKIRVSRRTRHHSGTFGLRRHFARVSKRPEFPDAPSEGSSVSDANDEAWVEQEPFSDSGHSVTTPIQPDVSLSNAEDVPRTVKTEFSNVPWSELLTDDRTAHAAAPGKLIHNPPLPESISKTWNSQPSSLKDTVRCFIWEAENVSKLDFTILDIGYNVIRAVERQGIFTDYIVLACVSTVLLSLLSVVFHWNGLTQPASNVTAISNVSSLDIRNNSRTSFLDSLILNTSSCDSISCSSSPLTQQPWFHSLTDSVLAMHARVLVRLVEKIWTVIGQPIRCLSVVVVGAANETSSTHHNVVTATFWHLVQGRWLHRWLFEPDLQGRLVIALGFPLRLNVYGMIFSLLCVAELTFQQRLLYAKYFFSLTSARRARKYRVPQFRLNKLSHIKCWLTLRSYLKKRGPQRSVETVIAVAFYIVFLFGLALCSQLISRKEDSVFSQLINWDILGLMLAIMLFLHRFIMLGTKITKKYRNFSVLITEQINLYLSMEKKPQKKDELMTTFQVLRLVEGLLKEVDGPFRVCGWTVNPLVYNLFKLVLLSCFSSLLSETLGFKLKLYKLKLNAANW